MQSARSSADPKVAIFADERCRRTPHVGIFWPCSLQPGVYRSAYIAAMLFLRHANLCGSHIDAYAIEGAQKRKELFGIVSGKDPGDF